jgi:hypothetical protein
MSRRRLEPSTGRIHRRRTSSYHAAVLGRTRPRTSASHFSANSPRGIPDGMVTLPRSRSRRRLCSKEAASRRVPCTVLESHFLFPVAGSLPR